MFGWDKYEGNLTWLPARTIFVCRHGSHAYGTNGPDSDEDYKGVFLPPKEYVLGFLNKIEQVDKGWRDIDCCMYDLRRFFELTVDSNPNMIELPFVNHSDWFVWSRAWEQVVAHRDKLLSRAAKHRFAGYAISQLKRINSHRHWLLTPPTHKPTRAEFGLPESPSIPKAQRDEVEAAMVKVVEAWQVDFGATDDATRVDLLNRQAAALADMKLTRDDQVSLAASKMGLNDEFVEKLRAERAFKDAVSTWDKYQAWLKERNPARAALEAKFGYDCYLDDTEFLTERGWLRYDDIADTDRLATLNQETAQMELQNFTERVCKPYNGPIHFIETRTTSCAVTPNHRMWLSPLKRRKETGFSTKYSSKQAEWSITRAEATLGGKNTYFHARAAVEGSAVGSGIRDDELVVYGAYVSEGCVGKRTKEGPSVLRFSQMEGGRLEKYMEMFGGVNLAGRQVAFKRYAYPRKNRSRKEVVWTLADRSYASLIAHQCGEGAENKRLPGWIVCLDRRQARLLMDVLVSGDGTNRKHSDVYYTASKLLANDVQTLAVMCGYGSQVWGPYPNGKNKPMYQVYICKNPYSVISPQTQKVENVWNRRIVCFTVPNEIFITRRNGKVAIQGNTKHGMHLVRLMRMAREILEGKGVIVRRPDAEELKAIRFEGAWSYDQLAEWGARQDAELTELMAKSPLPKQADRHSVDALCQKLVYDHLDRNPTLVRG